MPRPDDDRHISVARGTERPWAKGRWKDRLILTPNAGKRPRARYDFAAIKISEPVDYRMDEYPPKTLLRALKERGSEFRWVVGRDFVRVWRQRQP